MLEFKGQVLRSGTFGHQQYTHLLSSSLVAPKVAKYQNQLRSLLKIQIFWCNSDIMHLTFWSPIFCFLFLFYKLPEWFSCNHQEPIYWRHLGSPSLVQWFWSLCVHRKRLEALLISRLNPQRFWFDMSETVCISNKFLSDADAGGLGTTLLRTTGSNPGYLCSCLFFTSISIMWSRTRLQRKE